MVVETKVCKYCGREYIYDKKRGHRLTFCNSCSLNRRQVLFKKKAIEYKGGCCQRCGYDKCYGALHFHHRNPEDKEFGIGTGYNRAWDKLVKELDKCELICANCHAEEHYIPVPLNFLEHHGYQTNNFGTHELEHGVYSTYQKGCRCAICKEANRIKSNKYRNKMRV